jgi:quinoprotein glucose dehydrogenase
MRWVTVVFGSLFILFGAALVFGGVALVRLGGSSYYMIAGIGLLASGIELLRQRASGVWLYALVVSGTLIWSLAESGLSMWGLLPRLAMFAGLGAAFAAALAWRRPPLAGAGQRWGRPIVAAAPAAIALVLLAATAISDLNADSPAHTRRGTVSAAGLEGAAAVTRMPPTDADGDWPHWGRTAGGLRYSPLTQITPENVKNLEVAWVYHTGATIRPSEAGPAHEFNFEATPLKVRDKLFLCTPHAETIAIEPETGKEVWRFDPRANVQDDEQLSCRGVSYYEPPGATGMCAHRILTATLHAKLYALDADTGQRCHDFGSNGEVDLAEGMGLVKPGYYYVTSPPAIVRGKAVVGGLVIDNRERGEPSGVVRAFDAVTGKLAWAFDVGRPDRTGLPPAGESYTRRTPNVWAVMSADEALGLVYLPMGNETPDFFGGGRLESSERYASAVVAVDADTGHARWSFQTVHHDLWDFDLPAQPVLADIPEAPGAPPTPVVIVPTKQGLLFILDRRDGRPITPIEERPVPQGASDGDWTSQTQPFQTGIPFFGPPDLTEASMWGVTPLDQLWCRIQFKSMRNDGLYTPPSTRGSISYPGSAGVFEWGSVSIDPTHMQLIANTSWLPMKVRLVPRDKAGVDPSGIGPEQYFFGGPADGTPYLEFVSPFISPAFMPCQAPPYGHITALDLNTRQIAWRHTLGTSRNQGPFGIPSNLPIPSGVPNMGGSVTTASGLIFIAATADSTFRAFDTQTGAELWHAELPRDGIAGPMSYTGRDGRQYVVIAAGGHGGLTAHPGDAVVSYALPK